MIKELLNMDNLVELHSTLNKFAKHHNVVGFQQAIVEVQALHRTTKRVERDGSKEGLLRDEGMDKAYEYILQELNKKLLTL